MFCSLLEVTCVRKGADKYIDSSRGCGLCTPQHILHRKLDSLVEKMGKLASPEHDYRVQYSQLCFGHELCYSCTSKWRGNEPLE